MPYPPPPYDDSIVGTFQAGEAKAGSSWAYPSGSGLLLGATAPSIIISSPTVVVPAGILLGATPVVVTRGIDVVASPIGLNLSVTPSALIIDSTINCSPFGLLLGFDALDYAGQQYLIPHEECLVIELEEAVCI
jgi:hypothetical protein